MRENPAYIILTWPIETTNHGNYRPIVKQWLALGRLVACRAEGGTRRMTCGIACQAFDQTLFLDAFLSSLVREGLPTRPI